MNIIIEQLSNGWKKQFNKVSNEKFNVLVERLLKNKIELNTFFKPFIFCRYEDIKLILFNQTNYLKNKLPFEEEQLFLDEYEEETGKEFSFEKIAKQGVLMLNYSIKPIDDIWIDILTELLKSIFQRQFFILVGFSITVKYSHFIKTLIDEEDKKIKKQIFEFKIQLNKKREQIIDQNFQEYIRNSMYIENSSVFIKINCFLEQLFYNKIKW